MMMMMVMMTMMVMMVMVMKIVVVVMMVIMAMIVVIALMVIMVMMVVIGLITQFCPSDVWRETLRVHGLHHPGVGGHVLLRGGQRDPSDIFKVIVGL